MRISPNGTKVRTIPATVQRFVPAMPLRTQLRVAAYARVSTDEEEQLSSYEAQVDYYTRYIQSNPEWTFVEVYAEMLTKVYPVSRTIFRGASAKAGCSVV